MADIKAGQKKNEPLTPAEIAEYEAKIYKIQQAQQREEMMLTIANEMERMSYSEVGEFYKLFTLRREIKKLFEAVKVLGRNIG